MAKAEMWRKVELGIAIDPTGEFRVIAIRDDFEEEDLDKNTYYFARDPIDAVLTLLEYGNKLSSVGVVVSLRGDDLTASLVRQYKDVTWHGRHGYPLGASG